MKIKMMMSISGVGFALARGDETERFSDKDAHSLINSGAAVLSPVIAYETAVTVNQDTETAVAALNVGAVGTVEAGSDNTDTAGEAGDHDGQEPAGAGALTIITGETGTDNAGATDAGSDQQSDATQSVSGKGKGKAN